MMFLVRAGPALVRAGPTFSKARATVFPESFHKFVMNIHILLNYIDLSRQATANLHIH